MHSVNLIVVEDEPAILSGIAAQIKRMDLPISITGIYLNGAEALKDLSNSKPDLIITDVQMPVMTGLELISRLKEQQYPAVCPKSAPAQCFQLSVKTSAFPGTAGIPVRSMLPDSLKTP